MKMEIKLTVRGTMDFNGTPSHTLVLTSIFAGSNMNGQGE
jgi:hypothetical protein